MSKRNRLALLGGAIVLAIPILVTIFAQRGPVLPADYATGAAGPEVNIEVLAGASGSEIAQILFESDVVASAEAFFTAAVIDPRSSKIAPGTHRIQSRIPAKQALEELLDPKRISNLIQIREGAWTSEILKQMIENGFGKNELASALGKLKLPKGFSGTVGVLFPAQYSFGKGTSALVALQSMVNRFEKEARAAGLNEGKSSFTPMELLTIASLAQAEGDTQDFTKISRVIRNRLKIGMPLQFDSTVHFIKGTRGEIFLSADATTIDSAYNTYQNYGLPPGPIGNPGAKALHAALNPKPGDWLYFITVAPGDTRFTASYDQFLIWKKLYQENLRDGKFGIQK